MFYNYLKKFVKKFTTLWKFLRWFKDSLIKLSRLKDVLMMMILFYIWPKQTYRFSTRRQLPCKKNRYSKESKPSIPYELLESKSSRIPMMEEINVITYGLSFDLNNLKNLKGHTFIMSRHGSNLTLRVDNKGSIIHINDKGDNVRRTSEDEKKLRNSKVLKNNNLTYMVNEQHVVEEFKRGGHNVLGIEIYLIDKDEKYIPMRDYWAKPSYLNLFDSDNCKHISLAERIYLPPLLLPYDNWAPVGSSIAFISALSFYAKKINVYGWDFYLKSSPKDMSYWQLFFNMYKWNYDTKRSCNHFESALLNFYYGYQFSKLPHIKIHGYMGQLGKHHKLIQRIERVLFN